MKKIVAFCFFLLASLACGSYASAAQVDLQVRNVFYATIADQNRNGGLQPGFYVNIQNNGSDDFQGSFNISYSYDDMGEQAPSVIFFGTIRSGSYMPARLSAQENIYFITIDSKNEINETNEMNNNFYLRINDSQVRITSSWTGIIAADYYPTLYVLPNEYFFQQFSLSELNNTKLGDAEGSIIGFSYYSYAFGFPGTEDYYSEVQSRWPEGAYVDGILNGGKYSFYSNSAIDKYHTSCEWMANSSSSAIDYFWLGYFDGTAKGMAVGSEANIFINATIALKDLTRKFDGFNKTIKIIDRIRGDVNDDGVVDQADLNILSDVVSQGLYNPCMSFKNMYQERGLNYGAGIVMFNVPDFLSNCLINIWINDHNDPLVQGLGIGELMSETVPGSQNSSIQQVANSFEISGEKLSINASGADLYNVTAQTTDGKLFQATGKIGEKISIPDPSLNYRVETVRLNNPEMATKLFTPKVQDNQLILVRSTRFSDQINISGTGKLTIVNLSGQTLFTGNLDGNELNIPTSDWSVGMYIAKAVSGGKIQMVKLVK